MSVAPQFVVAIGEHERGGWCWAVYRYKSIHPNSNPHADVPARADGSKTGMAVDYGRTTTERAARKEATKATDRLYRIGEGATTEVWTV